MVDKIRLERQYRKWDLDKKGRNSTGKTHLKADCPECGKLGEMSVYSVNRVCTKITVACRKCATISLIYARKS